MKMNLVLAALATLWALPGAADTLHPVTLGAVQHLDAQLTILRPDGSEAVYSPADLETLPTYSLRTTTPWRSEPAEFEGVRLADILAANGLGDATAISVAAENDYSVDIPRAAWEALDILVATRADGAPISRRDRGPIQFIVDMDTYRSSAIAREDFLVWMAARIEAVR